MKINKENFPRSINERTVIAETYAAIDAAFGEIIADIPEECLVIVVSDHGFGKATRGFRLHQALAEAGFFVYKQDLEHSDIPGQYPGELRAGAGYLQLMDNNRTRAYMPTPGCYGLNINLEGRQRTGTVKREDYERVRADVTKYLLGLVEPKTNRPILRAVVPSDTAYSGPYSAQAPDLLLVPSDPGLVLLHEPIGTLWDTPGPGGLHRLEGILMIRSSGLEESDTGALVEEVAGTALELLGIRSDAIRVQPGNRNPNDAMLIAGIPIGAWSTDSDLSDEIEFDTAMQNHKLVVPSPKEPKVPDSEEEVNARLRAMGYL